LKGKHLATAAAEYRNDRSLPRIARARFVAIGAGCGIDPPRRYKEFRE
jgi:hypothetical protein